MRPIGLVALVSALLLSGCAGGGPIYWTRADSDFAQFQVDHQACLPTFSKDGYRNCMKNRGWDREHTGNGLPDERHFRGPEADEDFQRQKSADLLRQEVIQEQLAGRQHREGGALCNREPTARPPGNSLSVTLLSDLDAVLQEHRYCGEIDAEVDGNRVWMTCTCGARIERDADRD